MILSDKQKDLILERKSNVDILEGSVRSGKTFSLVGKFLTKVREMEAKGIDGHNYAIAFNKSVFETVLLPCFEAWAPDIKYYSKGRGNVSQAHMVYKGIIINIGSYGTIAEFKRILGSTIKCAICTEINLIPHEEYFTKLLDRMSSVSDFYFGGDLNPADPTHWIYDYANKCEPVTETPNLRDIDAVANVKRWKGYHFIMPDNPIMTDELIARQLDRYPSESHYLYKANILGLRCIPEGLVFETEFVEKAVDINAFNNITPSYLVRTLGVDTSYSNKSSDRSVVLCVGICPRSGTLYVFDEFSNNNKDKQLLASDLVDVIKTKWNTFRADVCIDSADSNTINTAFQKYREMRPYPSDKSKFGLTDRIKLYSDLLYKGKLKIHPRCKFLIDEFKKLVFDPKEIMKYDKVRSDTHSLDALSYSIIVHLDKIRKGLK